MKENILIGLLIFIFCSIQAQNELYIRGAQLHIEAGALIHVQGDFNLDGDAINKGRLDNDGTIELRGNYIIRSEDTEQTSTTYNSSGVVRFKNYGYGGAANETSHQNSNQTIEVIGTDATGDRAFYDIEIENDNQTSSGSDDNYVAIKGGDVEISNRLTFVIDSRLVTDDDGFDPADGSTYDNEVYFSSTATDVIDFGVGINDGTVDEHRIQAGRKHRYIEGVLAREVSGSGSYYFPVGLAPDFIPNDGMEAFSLDVTSATSQKITAYINYGSDRTDISNQNVYGDIGEDPNPNSPDPFSICSGGPDGIQDYINLNEAQSHEWIIENDGADFTYDIEIYPGSGLNTTGPATSLQVNEYNCGANSFVVRYLAKNGELYDRNTGALLPTEPAPSPFNTAGFPNGYHYLPPSTEYEGNKLSSLSSFSTFRIHGALDNATTLPVELTNITANTIDNEFIQVRWQTASEINNDYFEVQRSINAINWSIIDEVDGNGTTSETHDYLINDTELTAEVLYYYRLKQIDFDGSFEFSPIVSEKITFNGQFDVSEFQPNLLQSNDLTKLLFTTEKSRTFNYVVYDMTGKELDIGQFMVEERSINHPVSFETKDFQVGQYIVVIWDDKAIIHRKFIIVN